MGAVHECVAGRNLTSVSTNVTSIEDHAVSDEQFLFQVKEISLLFNG